MSAAATSQPAVVIVLTKLNEGFRAEVEGQPMCYFEDGRSGLAAVGGLLLESQEKISITVRWNTEDSWTARYCANDPKTRDQKGETHDELR